MSGATELSLPADAAELVSGIVGSLTDLSARAGTAAAELEAHRSGLAPVWASPAGAAATAEIGAVGVITGDIGTALADSAHEVVRYRDELELAVAEIAQLQERWDSEVRRHRMRLNDIAGGVTPDGDNAAAISGENSRHAETLGELRRQYDTIVDELGTVAQSVGAQLAGIAGRVTTRPGYPSDFDETVEDHMIARLAFLHQRRAIEAGETATAVILRAMDDGWISEEEARAIIEAAGEWRNDRHFAAALVDGLGPEQLLDVPMALAHGAVYPDSDTVFGTFQQVLAVVGTSLATATNPTSPTYQENPTHWRRFTEELTDLGTSRYAGHYPVERFWGLGVVLRHGTYCTEFLDTVGSAMYAYEQETPGLWPLSTDEPYASVLPPDPTTGRLDTANDPLVGLMTALGRNAEAGQGFLLGSDGDRLDYLLTDRPHWDDGGRALGAALETATIGLPPELQRDGAKIVARIVHDIGNSDTAHALPSVGRILRAWIHDVNLALTADTRLGSDELPRHPHTIWVGELADPMIPAESQPRFHAFFERRQLTNALEVILADGHAYHEIVEGQTVYARASIDYMASLHPGLPIEHRLPEIELASRRAAAVFGEIAQIHEDAFLRAGIDDIENRQRLGVAGHDRLIALASAGAGLADYIPGVGPVIEFGANVTLEGIDALLDDHPQQTSADRIAQEIDDLEDFVDAEQDAARRIISDFVVEAMLRDDHVHADARAWLTETHGPDLGSWFIDPETGAFRPEAMRTSARNALDHWIIDPLEPGAGTTIGTVLDRAGLEFSGGQVRGTN